MGMNRTFKAAVAALMLAVGLAGSVAAGPVEDGVVDAFLGNCVLNLPNLEKIRAASRVFGWKRLSPDAMTMLGPLDSGAEAEGWMATQDSLKVYSRDFQRNYRVTTRSFLQRYASRCQTNRFAG
jgi:hypothetical protein